MTNGQTMHTLPGSSQVPTTRWTFVQSRLIYSWRRPTVGEHPHCARAHESTYARFNGRVHHIWTGDRHSRLATLGRE
jgi:hypothetical protein